MAKAIKGKACEPRELPAVPDNMPLMLQVVWSDGVRWEQLYFNTEGHTAKFCLKELDADLLEDRAETLSTFYNAVGQNPEPEQWVTSTVYNTIATVDRVLMTLGELPHVLTMQELVTAAFVMRADDAMYNADVTDMVTRLRGEFDLPVQLDLQHKIVQLKQVLYPFCKRPVHTARNWLLGYLATIPEEVTEKLDQDHMDSMCLLLAMKGDLAHVRPSLVAAGLLLHVLDEQAEPYTCGYTLAEAREALGKIYKALDINPEEASESECSSQSE